MWIPLTPLWLWCKYWTQWPGVMRWGLGWDLQMPPSIDSQGIDFVLSKAHSKIGSVSLVTIWWKSSSTQEVISKHWVGDLRLQGRCSGILHPELELVSPSPLLSCGPTQTPSHDQAQKVKLNSFNTPLIGPDCLLGLFRVLESKKTLLTSDRVSPYTQARKTLPKSFLYCQVIPEQCPLRCMWVILPGPSSVAWGNSVFWTNMGAERSPGLVCCSVNGGSDKLGLAESWKLRVTVTTSHSVSPPGPISEWYTAGISTPFYRAAVCFKGRMTGVLPLCGTLSIIHK